MGLFSTKQVVSFERVFWRISGMRCICEYEIIRQGDTAAIAEYEMYYQDEKDDRRLRRIADCPADTMLSLLNECGILKWDGFHGKHPPGVKDGEMFSFEAIVNDGETIKASGSANFPKHFGEFRSTIGEMLKPVEE